MANKRENEPKNASEPADAGDRPPDGEKLSARLSIQLDESGAVAWDRMRPDTREKLQAALRHGSTGTVVPFAPVAGSASLAGSAAHPDAVPPELCALLYDSLSMLLVGLARRNGYPQEQASVLVFTAAEKDALVPATAKVLDKYGATLGKYQEEIVLGTLLTTIITGKLSLLRKPADVKPFPAPTSESTTIA